MQKLLLKKTVMFVAVFLSCVMFVNFTTTDFFKANVLSAYATETDDDDDMLTPEDLAEDTRYVQLLPLVFKDECTQLQTNEEGVVNFSTTYESDEFGDLDYNLTFYPPNEEADIEASVIATICDEVGNSEPIISTVNVDDVGGLETTLYTEIGTYNVELYSSSKPLSNLLQSIYFEEEENLYRLLENPYADIDEIPLDSYPNTNNLNANNDDENISITSLCGFFTALIIVAVTIVAYVVVTQTAEQIRAESNYTANQSLETPSSTGSGLALGIYIEEQHDTILSEYKFGFTTFSSVGCEVASVYNLMIDLEDPQYLSQVIYDFERWAIEYAIAWGKFGSEPKTIYRYLDKKAINYVKRTNYNRFKNAVTSSESEHYIESFWNAPWTQGIHTFYVRRNVIEVEESTIISYTAYNCIGKHTEPNIDNFKNCNYGQFRVGYVIL